MSPKNPLPRNGGWSKPLLMDMTILALIICAVILVFAIAVKSFKKKSPTRPPINIDFDTAKDREDKNRHFG